MKTIIIGALVLLILAGCANPASPKVEAAQTTTPSTNTDMTTTTPSTTVTAPDTKQTPSDGRTFTTSDGRAAFVVNSTWKKLASSDLSRSLARSLARATTAETYASAVDSYNASNIDDYLRIYYDSVPDIADAPTVSVFICNPVTYYVNMRQDNIPRQSLVDNAAGWRQDSAGQLLFIDHIPPAPLDPAVVTPYEYFAIYIVNADGSIEYEDHCGYLNDESFTGQWILDPAQGGWSSIESYFYQTQSAWTSYINTNPGSYKVLRQLYTPPVTP